MLDRRPKDVLPEYLARVAREGVDPAIVSENIALTRKFYASGGPLPPLMGRWYESLDAGSPDFSIYDDPRYLSEVWICWTDYSRKYVRSIRTLGLEPKTVVDLGCGIGYSTAALAEVYPSARVAGTNLESVQSRVARALGVTVVTGAAGLGHQDLALASEYFEHIPAPLEHLDEVLDAVSPTTFVIANAFGTTSLGHFREYTVGGNQVPGPAVSRAFSERMRERGYEKLKTGFWNNRPTVWRYSAPPLE